VLQQAPGIKLGVVIAMPDKQGTKKLVAYITPEDVMDRSEVLSFLQQKLPDYMVPSLLVELPELPLTSSGKVDRKRLPEPEAATTGINSYNAPRNITEQKLHEIWKDLLEMEQVGVDVNFFEAGGHSLLAIQMIAAIREAFEKEIPIKDIFDYPTIELLAARIAAEDHTLLIPMLTRSNRTENIPLSFAQERLWFIDGLQGTVHYHMPWVFRLTGDLNVPALETSFRSIVERHEVLRTVIREESGVGYQLILPSDEWQLQYFKEKEILVNASTTQEFIEGYIQHPFDLSQGPILRVAVVEVSQQEHIMIVVLHHIAFDGWSIPIMVDELVELYRSKMEQRDPLLKELPVQYADYAIWQRSYLSGDVLDKKLAYWKDHLSNVETLALPADYARSAGQSIRGGMVHKKMSKELRNGLVALSQQEGVTIFMTLLTAFKVLLHRYTGQHDICVGSPIAGRQQKELEGLMGFFVNTLALRTQVQSEMSIRELLHHVKQTTVGAYENQEVPFEKIVESLDIQRDLSRNPIFQVKFALQNTPNAGALDLSGVQLSAETYYHVNAQIDLSFDIGENAEGLFVGLTYCSDLYKEETIQRMIRHFENLLQAMLTGMDTAIGELSMLDADEQAQLINGFNVTDKDYDIDKTIPELFEEQVELYPNEIALVFENEQFSFRELDEIANRFAYYLRTKGVKEETLVPVCLDRSADMIVAILGILKAGGAYVPIDPALPAERIGYMLKDTGAAIIITASGYRDVIAIESPDAELICIDALKAVLPLLPSEKPERSITPRNLAYIIYTSGSTGLPKGVMIEHRGVINLTYNQV
ncbi:MAG: condensation domain-containing protein, partial [Chitinophagaceae bacterium]